jgi:hypothetical protein
MTLKQMDDLTKQITSQLDPEKEEACFSIVKVQDSEQRGEDNGPKDVVVTIHGRGDVLIQLLASAMDANEDIAVIFKRAVLIHKFHSDPFSVLKEIISER